jgi:hypothetical protein
VAFAMPDQMISVAIIVGEEMDVFVSLHTTTNGQIKMTMKARIYKFPWIIGVN